MVAALDMKLILTINSGSSSLKFALFNWEGSLKRMLAGKFDRIGLPAPKLKFTNLATGKTEERTIQVTDHAGCVPLLTELLEPHLDVPTAIAHRIVHGGM